MTSVACQDEGFDLRRMGRKRTRVGSYYDAPVDDDDDDDGDDLAGESELQGISQSSLASEPPAAYAKDRARRHRAI